MDIVSRQRINLLIQLADIRSVTSKSPAVSIVKRVAKECNFPQSELNQLLNDPEPIGTFGALSLNQKAQYLYSLGELMISIKLDNTKTLLCNRLVYDLGYTKKQLNNVINEIQNKKNSAPKTNNNRTKEEIQLKITA